MRVLGIDLAAQARATGVVVLTTDDQVRWTAAEPDGPADDDQLVTLAREVDVIGVDAPLGWPTGFVAAVAAHTERKPWPGGVDRGALTHRDTDRAVHRQTGRMPLSTSASMLGIPAMRCALLQHRWATEVWGRPAPRDGSGPLIEAYPAAALRVWQLSDGAYKGGTGREADAQRATRHRIVGRIAEACAGWLYVAAVAERCRTSDHVLDGLVTALIAVAAKAGMTASAPDAGPAGLEGWIHVPTIPLAALRPPG